MKRSILFVFFSILSILLTAQCGSTVPVYTVNLTGKPMGSIQFGPVVRNGLCCSSTNPDKCVRAIITLDSNSAGIRFSIVSGAIPSGSLFYQISCANPAVNVGEYICLSGVGPHSLTFCKPGNNPNVYEIASIPKTRFPDSAHHVNIGCSIDVSVFGLIDTTINWHDITSSDGRYDSFLSCTSGCDTVTITPSLTAPNFVDYRVCGHQDTLCNSSQLNICDTFRVYFHRLRDTIMDSFCSNGYYYFPNGDSTNTAGNYYDTINSVEGCDSFLTYFITMKPVSFTTIDTGICNGDSVLFKSIARKVTGTFYDTLMNHLGCDSFVTLNLIVHSRPSVILFDTICQGDSFFFRNSFLKHSGIYYDTLNTTHSCDSFISLNLFVKPHSYTNIDSSICFGNSVFFGGAFRNATGIYRDTLLNYLNCDSVVTLNLIVNPLSYRTIDTGICNGDSVLFKSIARKVTGTFYDTLMNHLGCDSFVTLNLIVHSRPSVILFDTICQGDSFFFRNSFLKLSGIYYDTLNTTHSCDSFISLNLFVKPHSYTNIDSSICFGNSVFFGGTFRNATGIYRDTLLNYLNCDSVITLNLIVKPISETRIDTIICNGESFIFRGIARTATGIFYDTLVNYLNCDSIISMHLTVHPTPVIMLNESICQGDSFLFDGVYRKLTGVYTDTLLSQYACDSFVQLNLTVHSLPIANAGLDMNRVNCPLDSVRIGGASLTNLQYSWSPNYFISDLNTSNPWVKPMLPTEYRLIVEDLVTGCIDYDTVRVDVLNVNVTSTKQIKNLLCNGDNSGAINLTASNGYPPYLFRLEGGTFNSDSNFSNLSAGIYRYYIQDSKGCTHSDTATVQEPPPVSINTVDKRDLICYNIPTGYIEVEGDGGIEPYNYFWDSLLINQPAIENLSSGIYIVKVRDSNNCLDSNSYVLTEPEKIDIDNLSITPNKCNGDSIASISFNTIGGTYPYEYIWSNGKRTEGLANLKQGNYLLTISDRYNCTENFNFNLVDPSPLTIDTIIPTYNDCRISPSGTIEIRAYGGTPNYNYRIEKNGDKSFLVTSKDSIIVRLEHGLYNIKVIDANGCTIDSSASIGYINELVVEVFPRDTTLELGQTVQLGYRVIEGDSLDVKSILWRPPVGLSCVDCEAPIVNSFAQQTYYPIINGDNVCVEFNHAKIRFLHDILYIPNTFSPNAKNEENRRFRVYSKNILRSKLLVFDRWGEKVFDGIDAHIMGWDGTYLGKPAPMNVYIYHAEITYIGGRVVTKKGDVTLLY